MPLAEPADPGERPASAVRATTAVSAADFSLLPKDETFSGLLIPFLLPYAAYVGLGALPAGIVPPEMVGLARFLIVAALLWHFRKRYRFGPRPTPRLLAVSAAASVAALALWVVSYRLSLALPWWRDHLASAEAARPTMAYWTARAVNSALLVPLFEELFCRAYLTELLFGISKGPGGFTSRLGRRIDEYPSPLPAPPLSLFSVAAVAALFALGHDMSAWIPAALYFAFTSWIYARTRSFLVCVVIHGLVNLAIAFMVLLNPGMRFLWF
jgi:uncharacterized protein